MQRTPFELLVVIEIVLVVAKTHMRIIPEIEIAGQRGEREQDEWAEVGQLPHECNDALFALENN